MTRRYLLKKDNINKLCGSTITGKDLADLLDTSQSVLSTKLRGKCTCSAEEVEKIASFFEVSIFDVAIYYVSIKDSEIKKASLFLKNRVLDKDVFYKYLRAQGLSRTKFAKIIESSETSIDRWCAHAGKPKAKMALVISKYFDVPLEDLFIEGEVVPYGVERNEEPDKKRVSVQDHLDKIDEKQVVSSEKKSADTTDLFLESFEEGNVLGNMKIINNNLLMMSNYIVSQFKSLADQISMLNNRLDHVENTMDNFDLSGIMSNLQMPTAKATLILSSALSDSEVLSICKKDSKSDDYSTYKDKVQKLLAYIGKRKNLVYNQVAHNFYKDFERIYGMSLTAMRKGYTKDTNTIKIIYDDKATREIFFNIVATEASHLAGDCISINKQ